MTGRTLAYMGIRSFVEFVLMASQSNAGHKLEIMKAGNAMANSLVLSSVHKKKEDKATDRTISEHILRERARLHLIHSTLHCSAAAHKFEAKMGESPHPVQAIISVVNDMAEGHQRRGQLTLDLLRYFAPSQKYALRQRKFLDGVSHSLDDRAVALTNTAFSKIHDGTTAQTKAERTSIAGEVMSALEELAHHLPGEEGRYTTKNKTFDTIASYLDRQERVFFLTHVWGVSAQAKASSALYGSGTNSATVLGIIATGKPQSSLPGTTVIETDQFTNTNRDVNDLVQLALLLLRDRRWSTR